MEWVNFYSEGSEAGGLCEIGMYLEVVIQKKETVIIHILQYLSTSL